MELAGLTILSQVMSTLTPTCRRFAFETPEETAARLAATGLKKSALCQIPVAVYGTLGIQIKATDCTICLADFMDGEKIRVLPKCNHGFHVMCIDTWLLAHSSCPTCRQSLLEQPTTETSSDAADVDSATGHNPGNAQGQQGDVSIIVDEVG
ncbi:RING-H2 finger protein ATL72-like isoform X2 [Mangifera indica]|uniref:RING-H2 finger protein ATL72-like isoform X2 n=1 Tax=Mangifera indica TaxID=29780 RepID=UPI001CFC3AFF|nr:RING-H2 finger protein ATL72-like isoform X2 [Mangifera indica]